MHITTRQTPVTDRELLQQIVGDAAHLLPIQGPIGVFIHHNTLHAFQHLPFEQAVAEASQLFGTEPYMSEEQYAEDFRKGRIQLEDVDLVLDREPNAPLFESIDRKMLRSRLLLAGGRPIQAETIQWELDEGTLLASEQDRALFQACLSRIPLYVQTAEPALSNKLRDRLLEKSGEDIYEAVHTFLIRTCGSYLDQGLAYWPMPDREQGFYATIRSLWTQPLGIVPTQLRGLAEEFNHQLKSGMDSDSVVLYQLGRLGAPRSAWRQIVQDELLALPGWAGLMRRLEEEPHLAPHEQLPCSLMDYLAVRLTLTSVAARNLQTDPGSLFSERVAASQGSAASLENKRLARAARIYRALKALSFTSEILARVDDSTFRKLENEVEAFDGLERRRIWHLSYEQRHERIILGPLGTYRRQNPPAAPSARPRAQVFFCLDEREESIRRQLEEIAPDFETLGAAGFYGIAVDYAGIDDAHGVPLCPVVVKPQHAVRERPVAEHRELHARRRARRSFWARIMHHGSLSSRTFVRGTASTAVLGLLSLFPLIAHVLTPRRYGRLMKALNNWILPEPRTELTLMRTDSEGHDIAEHLLLGFTVEEKVDRVASVLAPAGLRDRFARIVIVLGHGSTSLNNPHESAHDCGACGGRRGGPNGRLFAAMANRSEVRRLLSLRGIHIPEDTWFVGGYHDTCNDNIDYFDLESLPQSHTGEFEAIRSTLQRAQALDAHERSRRFEAAPANASPEQALWHVQERSEHLAQPRPEYGHCTNAVCIVGRRSVTRGLFLDRRAFLVSYDPMLDPSGEQLGKLLGAAIPVCAGISLEYYFSFVDNEGYGCGTKLPHNITGLIGIMNGPSSDLRTGLPWQMVEIHEPVRILFNIEATPEILMKVIHASPLLTEFVENRWMRLSTMDPETGRIYVYRNGTFEESAPWTDPLPEAPTSGEWYGTKREHLPLARITGRAAQKVAA
jgi:uncharacterized protein YbcC (UPF0753/DUF2309 family)